MHITEETCWFAKLVKCREISDKLILFQFLRLGLIKRNSYDTGEMHEPMLVNYLVTQVNFCEESYCSCQTYTYSYVAEQSDTHLIYQYLKSKKIQHYSYTHISVSMAPIKDNL